MNTVNVPMITYIIVSLFAIFILAYFLHSCNNNKEDFCGKCSGIGIKTDSNRSLLSKLYNQGKLTEYSKFHKNKDWMGMPWDLSRI